MKDRELIDLACPRIPDQWRRKYLSRPIERLPADMNAAFDRIYKLEREKDQLRKDFEAFARKSRFRLAFLSAAFIVSSVVVLWRLLLP
jgi:hypothetical protein